MGGATAAGLSAGAEQPVTGITQAGHDIIVLVEALIHDTEGNRNIQMALTEPSQTLRRGEQ